MQNTTKPFRVRTIQNVPSWIWCKMSPSGGYTNRASQNAFEEKANKKILEENKELNKLRMAEMLKEQKQPEIDQKAPKSRSGSRFIVRCGHELHRPFKPLLYICVRISYCLEQS